MRLCQQLLPHGCLFQLQRNPATRRKSTRLCFFYVKTLSHLHPSQVCMEAGMFALRERRVHVTQEDFLMSVAKILQKDQDTNVSLKKLWR